MLTYPCICILTVASVLHVLWEQETGSLEGLVITGLGEEGMKLLQRYLDSRLRRS